MIQFFFHRELSSCFLKIVPKFFYFWPQPCSVVLYLEKKKSSIFLTLHLHIICNHFCKNYYFVIYFYSSKLDWVVLYFLNMDLFFLAKNRYSSPLFWSLLSSIEKYVGNSSHSLGKFLSYL